jgi:hypothetical protein
MPVRLALACARPDCPRDSADKKKGKKPELQRRGRQIVTMNDKRLFLFVAGFVDDGDAPNVERVRKTPYGTR